MPQRIKVLTYPVRLQVLLKYFSQCSLIIAGLTAVPFTFTLFLKNYLIGFRYFVIIAFLSILGILFAKMRVPRSIQPNEGIILACFLFLVTPLLMSYPLTGYGLSFGEGLFEAISGSTTTGLSTLSSVEQAPLSFVFSRAWMQWYGGLGIVILSLALLTKPGIIAKGLAVTEDVADNLVGNTRAYARQALLVYASLTLGGFLLLWALGAGFWNGVLYGLAAVSTGGFSPHDDSARALDSGTVQTALMLISVSGAVSLSFYYRLRREGWRNNVHFLEMKTMLIAGCIVSILLLSLWLSEAPVSRHDLFQIPFLSFSAQSTTGFSTLVPGSLPDSSKLILILAMTMGGGMGSTAGGIKAFRVLAAIQCIRLMISKTALSRHAVVRPRLADQVLSEAEMRHALVVIILFVLVIFFSWVVFVGWGYDPIDALFEVVSAIGTVGLSTGITASTLPAALKGILCMDMLMGRLEIVAWLVLMSPYTWLGRRQSL